MRHFGFFDYGVYEMLTDDDDLREFGEHYPNRKLDFCEAELDVMADCAGINPRSMRSALSNLKQHGLIEEYSGEYHDGWKVFLRPTIIYKRDYLNEKVMKRYGKKLPVMV